MKLVTGRTDEQAGVAHGEAKPAKPPRIGKSGEGAGSVLEQLILQEQTRTAQRKPGQDAPDPER